MRISLPAAVSTLTSPALRDTMSDRIVSATAYASIIVVASTPLAPLALHPEAYMFLRGMPDLDRIRPALARRWEEEGSKKAMVGSTWKPSEVTTREVVSVEVCSVEIARPVEGSRTVCARVSSAESADERDGVRAVGMR